MPTGIYVSAQLYTAKRDTDLWGADIEIDVDFPILNVSESIPFRLLDRHWFAYLRKLHGDDTMNLFVEAHSFDLSLFLGPNVLLPSKWPKGVPYRYREPQPLPRFFSNGD